MAIRPFTQKKAIRPFTQKKAIRPFTQKKAIRPFTQKGNLSKIRNNTYIDIMLYSTKKI